MDSTLILENYIIGPGGADEGNGRIWVDTVNSSKLFSKIIVLTTKLPDNYLKLTGVEYIEIYNFEKPYNLLRAFFYYLHLRSLVLVLENLRYHLWLVNSFFKAYKLAQGKKVIIIHANKPNLVHGSYLPYISSTNKSIICGNFPVPASNLFDSYINRYPLERLYQKHFALLERITRHLRKANTLTCSNPKAVKFLEICHPKQQVITFTDPFDLYVEIEPIPFNLKKNQVVYVDRPEIPRKGRDLLIKCLKALDTKACGGLRFLILTPAVEDWPKKNEIIATKYVPTNEFLKTINESRYFLNTSWREGSSTSLAQASAFGSIPIVVDGVLFKGLLPEESIISVINEECNSPLEVQLSNVFINLKNFSTDELLQVSNSCKNWALSEAGNKQILKLLHNLFL